MPYRKTRCLTKGRREEKERKLNTRPIIDKGGSIAKVYHQPQNSGIPANNTRPSKADEILRGQDCEARLRMTKSNINNKLKYWAGESIRFLLLRLLAPDFPLAESHPEPAPRSLRRRISHVQTKGGYQYAN